MKISRRGILHFMLSGIASFFLFFVFKISGARVLPRPPASLVENEFLKYCTRCYKCIDVCPAGALHPASILDGISNLGTPVLDWNKCILCMECVRVCPTGAIKKVPKEEVDIGNAVIDPDTCLSWTKKRRCKNCYKACKYDAIKLEKRRFPVIIEDKCNGCGACVERCPTDPKSIVVHYDKVKRFDPSENRFALRLEDRVGSYDFPPPGFKTWITRRIEKLAIHYGVMK
ncbi:MAG: 4Fe-4S dicluster domain-containing protein [Deltaproteobacteria bacterium]|nr:4Fe-4S dicluster domain-containing protein [Deltaproteobacteria bacterium]MBW2648582.1 4Fe-4S dicluster domain-containing protein [Deltaproteobacteria bacterium]